METKKTEKAGQPLKDRAKKIPDATLIGKTETQAEFQARWFEVQDPEEVGYDSLGDKDAPPLEMTDELLETIVGEEREKEKVQNEIRSKTEHYTNGVNEWKLIAKTYNNFLDWEHVTQAMEVGGGCLVCVKEAIGQKMHSTMTYVPGVFLIEKDKKWFLKKLSFLKKLLR